MKARLFALCTAAAALCALAPISALAAAGGQLRVVERIPGPDGGWDYASYDAARRRIYVAHGAQILALDLTTEKLNAHFASGVRFHEVVVVPGADLLVATDSGDSTVKLLRASDGQLLKALRVDADPDGAAYDPASGLVVVINRNAGVLTLIDPKKQSVVGTIAVGDVLEFGQPDGQGRFYVNIENKGQVAVVDLTAREVLSRYNMAGCERPTGLAYVEGRRIISSCGGLAKVLDATDGHEIASLKIGGFPDAVLYDSVRHIAYIPTALDGKLWAIDLRGDGNNSLAESVSTRVGARTGAVDLYTGRIYLPSAEYNLPVSPGTRPTTTPGPFDIVVLDR